ncbi:MAG: hypothetical protein ACOX02_04820 [Acholeplasmatales bacterium]
MSLLPLFPFIIGSLLVLLVFLYGLIEDKFHLITFSVSVVNALGFLVYIFMFKNFEDKMWFLYVYYGHSTITLLILLFAIYLFFKKLFSLNVIIKYF